MALLSGGSAGLVPKGWGRVAANTRRLDPSTGPRPLFQP
jgi:hypothetical protein